MRKHGIRNFLICTIITCIFVPSPAAQAAGWKIPIYAPDGRIAMVGPESVDSYTAVGWSTEPIEFIAEDGGIKGTIAWEYGSGCLRLGGYGWTNGDGNWFGKYRDSICTVYIKRGVGFEAGVNFTKYQNLNRVELSDSITEIPEHTFSGNVPLRIGIPSSVTSLSTASFNLSGPFTIERILSSSAKGRLDFVIYCEKDSAAHKFAADHWLNYKLASQVFTLDGRTCMVSDEELPAYLSSGWYLYPVVTMYAPDGRSAVIAESERMLYENAGWGMDKSLFYTTMYALDGRTADILTQQVANYQAVGWYLYPDYICARADQITAESGYAAGTDYIEKIMENTSASDPTYWIFCDKRNALCAAWKKTIGSPIAILGHTISYNSIGIPEVNILFRNLTGVEITSFEVRFTCVDAYGNATTDYPWRYNGSTFTGYSDNSKFSPYETDWATWTMYSNERTAIIRNAYILRAAFSDGSIWKQ